MSKVSVIIPTYNCVRFLPEALDSVFRQTYQNFEIVVVDDGSTDDTRELVKSYIDKYPGKLNYIYQENQGLACARNTAINHAKGEYIAILDADDIFLPTKLEEEIRAFEANPEVGIVHSNIAWITESGEKISVPKRNPRSLSGKIFNDIFLRNAHISAPTVLIKKEYFDHVGLFDENLTRLGCEDRDMWLRLARITSFLYLDKVLAYYRIRNGSMSKDDEKMIKARYYVVNKFFPRSPFLLLKRKALARIHEEMGEGFFEKKDLIRGRKEFARSIKFWPFRVLTWVNFCRSFIKIKD